MKSKQIINRDTQVISPSLTRATNLVIERGKGVYVWDIDGKKYLDFGSGIGVMNAGYSVKAIQQAIRQQLAKLTHCAFSDFYAEPPVKYAETLCGLTRHQRVF